MKFETTTVTQRMFTEREVAEAFAAFVKEQLQPYAPADVIRSYIKTFADNLFTVEAARPVSVPSPLSVSGPLSHGTISYTANGRKPATPVVKYYANEEALATHPHCDPDVLHGPGKCTVCDEYNTRQNLRVRNGVNFTGETQAGLRPCPSDAKRGFGTAEKWEGNAAQKPQPPARKTGQVWKVHYRPSSGRLGSGVIRLKGRHHTGRGWECDNVENTAFFWINDNHWSDPERYGVTMELLGEWVGSTFVPADRP
jgi:hypothetical protein